MLVNLKPNKTAQDAEVMKERYFGANANYINAIAKSSRNIAENAFNFPATN